MQHFLDRPGIRAHSMLRTHLAALLLCNALVASAQDELPNPFRKGQFYVSASAGWKSQDYDLKDISHWNLEPQVGYFIIDNVAVGIGGVVGLHEFDYVKDNGSLGTTTFNIHDTNWGALGPTVRGHIGGPRLSAFAQIGAFFGGIHQASTNNLSNTSVVVEGVREGSFQLYDLGAGLVWYYKQTIGIELMAHYYLGYAQTTSDYYYSTGEQVHYDRATNSADGGGATIGLVFLFGLSKGQ
ncbi:MAG TPA: hypothetical protein PLB89_01160 [Flavobacteriales bacterium]|nr:hypothetical protein [Flavobacteriales bacterium]